MKKNKMMRLASGLLVLVLLTTGIIGGTLAKYTTLNSASDTARVAKWGVTVGVSGNLFGKDYNSNSAKDNQDSIVAATSTNVHATDKNVVAPGTENKTGLTVEIAGTPEVAYKIEAETGLTGAATVEDIFLAAGDWGVMVEAKGLNAATTITDYYTKNGDIYTKVTGDSYNDTQTYYKLIDTATVNKAYYPIDWKVKEGNSTTPIDITEDLTAISDEMIESINTAASTPNGAGIECNTSYTLTWKWPFESSNDGADTILGDLMAGTMANGTVVKESGGNYTSKLEDGKDYNLDVVFGLKVTATQVD